MITSSSIGICRFVYSYHKYRVDHIRFDDIRKLHRLKITFGEYPTMLIKMINNCIRDPTNFQDVLAMGAADQSADLIFQQSVEYKTVELYKCRFEQADEDSIRSQVSFKFRLAHYHQQVAQSRLQDVAQLIKQKNPSLLT